MLLVVVLVVFVYFGGKYVPSVLRQNKELLLGIGVGMVVCSFMGLRLEGLVVNQECCQLRNMDENLSARDRVEDVVGSSECDSCPGGGIDCDQYEENASTFLERCSVRSSVQLNEAAGFPVQASPGAQEVESGSPLEAGPLASLSAPMQKKKNK